ncbi:hypothetical protein CRUP_030826, partial [Coryphaenoides rupestris]
ARLTSPESWEPRHRGPTQVLRHPTRSMDPGRAFRRELEGLDLQPVPPAVRACNDYVDRPVFREPLSHEERLPFGPPGPVLQPLGSGSLPRSQSHNQAAAPGSWLSRSSTVSSSMSRHSAASDQRLLSRGPTRSQSGLAGAPVRSQPKGELKPRASPGKDRTEAELEAELGMHMFICERCGRCKCGECCAPRRLPSCWACGERCLCSAECLAEHATCLCCVKGMLYHCSAQGGDDDDEACAADRPCSCGAAHRGCAGRWAAMGLLSLCLPCLCCYPPARLCLALCRGVHDRAARPGCRCRNTNTVCRKISASRRGGYPALRSTASLEKPL